jgi:secondary thiamine-phosphate synthase enzyme
MKFDLIKIHTEKMFTPLSPYIYGYFDQMYERGEFGRDSDRKPRIPAGLLTVFSRHTTCGIKILENEILSLVDLKEHLEKLAPKNGKYHHDNIDLRDVPANERINGYSHVQSLYINHSETIPILGGDLDLGKWQEIFLVELDGPREREIRLIYQGA